jgi:glutamyl-tRNA synthetase
LYARHNEGKLLLRIEDTDLVRSEEKYLEEILEGMKWLGLDWDGEPVYQSRRFELYREKARDLLGKGKAYREGDAIIYKVQKGVEIEVEDMIHGNIVFNTDQIKDQVMIKSDGSPAYNFCCVIDDAELSITHIIRGDDHISNTPKQVLFYQAMGLPVPRFAHMPLMMGVDGAKLSKRHGAVAVAEYRQQGILPEALVNYLMLLGWFPGEDREILSLREAVSLFDISQVNDTQVKFDMQKLRWLNAEYIMKKKDEELLPLLKARLVNEQFDLTEVSDEYVLSVIALYKVRIKTLNEFSDLADCFFTDDFIVDEKGKRKYLEKPENMDNLREFAERLEGVDDFSEENIEQVCRGLAEERQLKAAGIIHPTRVAISGKTRGAGLFEMMHVLGKKKVLERIRKVCG